MHEVNGNDLLGGTDHEFVVNLYSVILNRWPDEDGYRHHLERVENRPEMRRQLIDEVAGSPEGRNIGVAVRWPDAPAAAATPAAPPPPGAAAPADLAGHAGGAAKRPRDDGSRGADRGAAPAGRGPCGRGRPPGGAAGSTHRQAGAARRLNRPPPSAGLHRRRPSTRRQIRRADGRSGARSGGTRRPADDGRASDGMGRRPRAWANGAARFPP